jgi:hypothetical protein
MGEGARKHRKKEGLKDAKRPTVGANGAFKGELRPP